MLIKKKTKEEYKSMVGAEREVMVTRRDTIYILGLPVYTAVLNKNKIDGLNW